MSEILARLDEGDLVFVILCAIGGAVTIVYLITTAFSSIFGGADGLDEDELAERIEQAIKDATVDLLDALKAIEANTEPPDLSD